MKNKRWLIISLIGAACISIAAGFSSPVHYGLQIMMNELGKFKEIHWSNGQITRYEDIGSGGYGTSSVFNLGSGTITGNLAVTGTISGDGSQLTGVIAAGINGTVFVGTDTFRFVPAAGKDFIVETSGTGSAKLNNGTTSFTLKNPVQHYYYPNGLYSTTTANATEVPFFSIVVAPKVMGANGQMSIYALFEHGTTSATNPFKIYINDTVGTRTLYSSSDLSSSNYSATWLLDNCGSTSLQYIHGSTSVTHGVSSSSTQVVGTHTVNTNNTCTVSFAGAGTDTFRIYKALITTTYLE